MGTASQARGQSVDNAPAIDTSGIGHEDIDFLSDGIRIRGRMFLPEAATAGEHPGVVLTHGWAMTASGNLADYARVFARAGFVAMTIDFRNLGASDGVVRQDLDPNDQVEDIRNAITFLAARPEVDAERIGIWGSSYSGGHVLVVAAVDPRVKCVVSQVPTIDGMRAARMKLTADQIHEQERRFAEDRLSTLRGGAPDTVKTVSADPRESVLYPGEDAYRYMTGDGRRSPSWRNETTLRSLERARVYMPGAYVSRIAPTPLLMVIATDDTTCPTPLQREAFETAGDPKQLHEIVGGHYTPYVDEFDDASAVACAWFSKHL